MLRGSETESADLDANANNLFSQCYPLFVAGMREGIKHRLEAMLGTGWFQSGVTAAVTENQKENLSLSMTNDPGNLQESYLDIVHFHRIIYRNHSLAFADALPNLQRALDQLRAIRVVRHRWAHASPLSLDEVASAIASMLAILVPLRRPEALEIRAIEEGISGRGEDNQELKMASTDQELDSENPEDDDHEAAASSLWRELQSYLVLDFTVEDSEKARGGENMKKVTVRVSNTAPSGADMPVITFDEVSLHVETGGGDQSTGLGRLEPGGSSMREFEFMPKQLASAEFSAQGTVDRRQFFLVRSRSTLPSEITNPLLTEFTHRFEDIDLGRPLAEALVAVKTLTATGVTLAEAASVRGNLHSAKEAMEAKRTTLSELFSEFHLSARSGLGSHCQQALVLMNQAAEKLDGIDAAISDTDADAINEAVAALEQSHLAILQVEQSTSELAGT